MKINFERFRVALIVVLAILNAFSIRYVNLLVGTEGFYFGTETYGWNPTCIAFFALDCILLSRFLTKGVLQDKGRIIISAILGFFLAFFGMLGIYMYYGTNAIFDQSGKFLMALLVAIGLAFFTIPLFSELTGLMDKHSTSCSLPGTETSSKFPILYLFITWCLFFLRFVPLFLYWYPGNYIADAGYQVCDYMNKTITTHHPPLHTFLLGKAYEIGYFSGNVNSGYVWYTLGQMLTLSFSFAFFMAYLYKRKVSKIIRVVAFCLFFINPVNAFFAISTVKGVYGSAFLIIALVFLLMAFDCQGKEKVKECLLLFGFIVFSILSCHFRNNMIYAFVVGGLVAAILKKGMKKKLILLLAFLCIFVGFKGSSRLLNYSLNVRELDTERESLSVPLSCLARVAVTYRDSITDEEYARICEYIPEDTLSGYSIAITDGIKGNANENLLRTQKIAFLKLVIRLGLKCPGAYIEQMVGLTTGYWYPFDYPFAFSGTGINMMPTQGGYESPSRINYLPLFSGLADDLYMYQTNGRINVPLLGWCWRSTIYVWAYAFAFLYLIRRKDKKGLTIIMIPFVYLLTCFLGPVAWLRYIYVNVSTMPLLAYACMSCKVSDHNGEGA